MSASSLRYALVGTGAVGCSLGSDMLEAGLDITFIDQWPDHVEAMKSQGLTMNLELGSRTIPVS